MTCTILSTGFGMLSEEQNEFERPISEIKAFLREEIWRSYINGFSDFYVTCERGISLWAAEIICALKLYNPIRLHVAVPYEDQAADWDEALRDRYYNVHSKADTVEILSPRDYEGCVGDADRFMSRRSHAVMIVGGRYGSDEEHPELGCIRICRTNVIHRND